LFAQDDEFYQLVVFVAIRNEARVDFAGVKYVSNRGLLRLEMRVAGGWGSCDSTTFVPMPQGTKIPSSCSFFQLATAYYYCTSV
jgi:hypothetical protein